MTWKTLIIFLIAGAFKSTFARPIDNRGLYVHDVELEEDGGDGLLVRMARPCGSRFAGFVLQDLEIDKKRILEVAAAFEYAGLQCSKGPESVTYRLQGLDFSTYVEIRSVEIKAPVATLMAQVYDIGQIRRDVYAVIENRCAPYLGSLFKPNYNKYSGQVTWEVSGLHRAQRGTKERFMCDRAPLMRRLIAFKSKTVVNLKPFVERSHPLSNAYELKLRPIARIENGKAHFKKSCNELTIGVAQSTGTSKVTQILVAKYPNYRCDLGLKEDLEDEYPIENLPIAAADPINTPELRDQEWNLKVLAKKRGKSNYFEYLDLCQQAHPKDASSIDGVFWTVWSSDRVGQQSLGLLVPQSRSQKKQCQLKRLSPKIGPSNGRQQSINPLRFRNP